MISIQILELLGYWVLPCGEVAVQPDESTALGHKRTQN